MNTKILTSSDIEIEKRKFHYCKYPTDIGNIVIKKNNDI